MKKIKCVLLVCARSKKQKGQKNENRKICFFLKLSYLLETKVAGAKNVWRGVRGSPPLKIMEKNTSAFHSRGLSESN